MKHRRISPAAAVALVIAVGSSAVVLIAQRASTSAYTPPRTPWGDPDLQGVYEFQTRIPLERPEQLAGKATLTDEELAKLETPRTTGSAEFNQKDFAPGSGWNPLKLTADNRTSLIIDPPDGRVPLSPEGEAKFLALEEYRRLHQNAMETWAEEGSYSRCISRTVPRLLQGYDGGTQIIQSPGYVTLVYEQLDTIIIPLDGRPALDPKIRQWLGESRGHWEGDTLVVEVTNFNDKEMGWPPMRDKGGPQDQLGHTGVPRGNLKLTERFKPVGPDRIEYILTNEDPTWFSRPWTLMLPWERSKGYQQFEYACNEGNVQMEQALRNQRIEDDRGQPYKPLPVVSGGEQSDRLRSSRPAAASRP